MRYYQKDQFLNQFQNEPIEIIKRDDLHVPPLVSVVVTTYNHAKYITACLESIINQETSFSFEILIGEDESTDGTREICLEFQKRNPKFVTLILNSRKNNIKINNRPSGRFNWCNTFFHAQGKYIALCEGDDYWTHPSKLQHQVDFLRNNPDYSICFHNAKVIFEESKKADILYSDCHWTKLNRNVATYSIKDLILSSLCPTASVIFVKPELIQFPDWFFTIPYGDIPLLLLMCKERLVKYFDNCWSVYRRHPNGMTTNFDGDWYQSAVVSMYLRFLEYFNGKYKSQFVDSIRRRLSNIKDLQSIDAADRQILSGLGLIHAANPKPAMGSKRIVIITDEFPVLTETFIRDQVKGLVNRDLPIEIWTRRINKSLLKQSKLSKHKIFERIRFIKLPPDNLRHNRGHWREIFFQYNPDIDINSIHAIQVHFGWNFNIFEPILNVIDAMVLVSFHGYDGSAFIKEHGGHAYANLFDRADIITTPSHYMEKALVEAGCSSEKIKVHRYGINLSTFSPSKRTNSNSRVVLLTVARLVEKKGIEYALRAFSQIPRKMGAIYRILGDGPLRQKLEKLTHQLSIQDRVVFLGAKDHEIVQKEMSQADIFILTSVTSSNGDQEGVPVGLIEAQAMGLAVVSSKHAGIPELVSDRRSGYLAEEKNVDQIARYLFDLVNDDKLRAEFRVKARNIVKQHFNIETLNDRLASYLTSHFSSSESLPVHSQCYQLPSVSIVIPTHKRPAYLKQAIDSALAQNLKQTNTEILIISDGYDEETERLIKCYPTNQIRYIRKEHSGAVDTRNMAIDKAYGDYLLWLDDDDLLEPNALSTHLSVLSKHPDTDVIYGKLNYFDDATGKFIKHFEPKDWSTNSSMLLSTFVNGCCIPNPATLVKKSAYIKVGLYNEEFRRAHDYEFWTRAASTLKFKMNDNVICRYRIHSNNMSFGNKIDFSYESLIIRNMVHRYGLKRLFFWLDWNQSNNAQAVSKQVIAKSLYAFGDYFNCYYFLSQIPQDLWSKDILSLAFNCSLFIGKAIRPDSDLISNNSSIKNNFTKFNQLSKRLKKAILSKKDDKCRKILTDYKLNGLTPPAELLLKVGLLFKKCGAPTDAINALRRAQMLSPYIFDQNKKVLNQFDSADKEEILSTAKRILKSSPLLEQGELDKDFQNNLHKDVNTLIQIATLDYESENFISSINALKRIITIEPNHWDAYSLLVDVLQQSGQQKLIVEELNLIEACPNLPAHILAVIGNSYEAAGDLAQANHFVEKALDKEANCARALNLKGVISYRNGKRPEAARYFQKASEYDENWGDPWTNMGTLHWEQGTPDKALQCFEIGFQLSPTAPNVATTYHIAISHTKNYEQARVNFKNVVSRHPDFRKGRFLYIDVLIQLSDYQEAWNEIQDLIERFGADHQLIEAAEVVKGKISPLAPSYSNHQRSGKRGGYDQDTIDTSAQKKTIVYISGKSAPKTKLELLKKLKVDGRNTEFIVLSSKSAGRKPVKISKQKEFRSIIFKSHDTPGKVLNHVMARSAGDTVIVLRDNVAPYQGWMDDLVMAHAAVPKAGLSGPLSNHANKLRQRYASEGVVDSCKTLKSLYRHRRIPVDSLDDLCVAFDRKIFEHCGPFDERYRSLAYLYQDFCHKLKLNGYRCHVLADMVLESLHQTGAKFNWSADIDPRDFHLFSAKWNLVAEANPLKIKAAALAWREHARQSYFKEAFPQAAEALVQAFATDPENTENFHILADVISQSGQSFDFSAQLDAIESIVHLKHQPAETLAAVANCYELCGDLNKAENLARHALDRDSGCAMAWNLKGVIAYRRNNREEALRCFQRASSCDPGWGDPHTNMGSLYWQDGNAEEGCRLFARGFALSPTAPHVAASYHAAITACNGFESARPHFAEAAFRYPDFRKSRLLYIDVLIQLEEYRAALTEIQDVIHHFGADREFLNAAKAVRQKIDPATVSNNRCPSLSLCMIVKDEEKNIATCLANAKSLADEMVIVDTGSTDNTRDIAEIFEARVYDYDWQNDFAAARNFGLEKARGEWILVMDADEIIAENDHKKIRQLLAKTNKQNQAYMVVTRNYTHEYNSVGWEPNGGQYPREETGAGWIPSEKVRLFPNKKSIRFEYPIHEVVGPSLDRNNIRIDFCPVPIHHYGKLDTQRQKQKDEHYYKIGIDKLKSAPNAPVAIRELAVQAAKLEKFEDAIGFWSRLVELQPNDADSYINMAYIYANQRKYSKAKSVAQKAIKLAPNIKEGHFNLGVCELHLNQPLKAETIFLQLTKSHKNYHSAIYMLGASQFCQGHSEKGSKTLHAFQEEQVWNGLHLAFQKLVESLMAAGCNASALNLASGIESLGCSNEKIEAYRRQLVKQAA